jgi:hypothetical protein
MNLRVKAWHLPPRLITGAYFLNAGLSTRGADHATAGQLHGFAAGTYPLLGKLDAKRFTAVHRPTGQGRCAASDLQQLWTNSSPQLDVR